MASALPEELRAAIDIELSVSYWGKSLDGIGCKRSDLRKVFWFPHAPTCQQPRMHRCIKSIRTVAQAHDDVMVGMACIACRICAPRLKSRRTQLEADGYAACFQVLGSDFFYATEWMSLSDTRRSVDMMVISMRTPHITYAVQFDGSQHKLQRTEDLAFDHRLVRTGMCTHAVRLAHDDINAWHMVLRASRSSSGGVFVSPSLATHLVLSRQVGGAAEHDQRPGSTQGAESGQ
jgi:hypothetical protein